jgi:large subunit ribosomal protein L25
VPEHIELDVSGMEIGGTMRIAELVAPDGVTILGDPEQVVATITAPTKEVEPELTEEELAALEAEGEGAEGAEGEAAGDGGEDAPAEAEAEASGDETPAEG